MLSHFRRPPALLLQHVLGLLLLLSVLQSRLQLLLLQVVLQLAYAMQRMQPVLVPKLRLLLHSLALVL